MSHTPNSGPPDPAVISFVPSDTLIEEAAAAFANHEARIHDALPTVEIRHVGGTSLPGLLTAGDVDVQVRVETDAFDDARNTLSGLYAPIHKDMWSSEGAFFSAPESSPPVEVALTTIGGAFDLHHGEAWRLLRADDRLIERYNELKRECAGRSADEYRAAKRAFFYELLGRRP